MGTHYEGRVTLIVYIVFVLVIAYVIFAESKDINCRDTDGELCGPLAGRAYAYGKPEPGDTKDELLDKVRITARYEMNSIHWRRSFVVAAISAFLLLFIIQKRLPKAREFIIAFLVIYIFTYLAFTLFQRWVAEPALSQMEDLIDALKDV